MSLEGVDRVTEMPESILQSLGLRIPQAPVPTGAYVPTKRVGELLFVSGQGPTHCGEPLVIGQVDADVSIEQARDAARECVLNCLAAIAAEVTGLAVVKEVVQLRGFVNCSPGFWEHAHVLDAASDLLLQVFGRRGKHTRAAIGVSSLPMNIPLEIEMIVRVGHA